MIGDFDSPLTFYGSVWIHVWAVGSKGTVSSVPAWFRVDSGTNLIKPMEIVTGRWCVWLFSSVVWVLERFAGGPRFESPVEPFTVSSPVTFGGSLWINVRAASSKKTVPSHWWTHTFAKYSSCDAVNLRKCFKSIRDYDLQMRGITWIMLRPVTQETPSRYLCCKSSCTNIIIFWWEKTETQCSVLVNTKVLYPTTLFSSCFG